MQPISLETLLPHLRIAGRSSRAEWWRVHVICAVLVTVFDQMFIARLEQGLRGDPDAGWLSLLWAIVTLALWWVSFASVVRRFHDRGKSGWWALLYFVPGIGWLWILIECGFLPGKPAARVPAFTPASTPAPLGPAPAAASRSAPRLQATPRTGTIQRVERKPLDAKRALKLAGNAIGLIVLAVILYRVVFDPSAFGIFKNEIQTIQSQPAE
ncbi:MAG TPA: DUF805 domain-containing protein [Dongiaceae bacterium]|nr:DUF805 domain-containing protein [Dongiaceae bacterium]